MRVEAIPAAGAEAMAFKALVHLARGQIKANWAHQGLHVYFGRERHVATVRRSIRSAWPHGRAQRGCILCMVAGRKHRPVALSSSGKTLQIDRQSSQESRLEEAVVCV